MPSYSDLLTQWSGKDASARATVELCLAAIRKYNDTIKAYITVVEDEARAEADAIDAAPGKYPLRGMPISVKDVIDTAGLRTTMGSRFFKDNVPKADAEVVRRLKKAGAVVVGKANMHEFAFGATSQNEHYGGCRNPWNVNHIPGGSSGGSGASVAADMCIGSLGTDTGGSVRCPAAFNGITGLRPTRGRISNRGVFPVSAAFDTVGPMARRAVDVACIFNVMAGYDDLDPISKNRADPDVSLQPLASFKGIRIGVPRAFFFEECHAGVVSANNAVIDFLRDAGATTTEIDLPGPVEVAAAFSGCLVLADGANVHRERLEKQREHFGTDVGERFSLGLAVSGIDYARAMRVQEQWVRTVQRAFRDHELLVTPTCPVPAPRIPNVNSAIGTSVNVNRINFVWAMSGAPSISLPCGFADDMPVGVQLVAPWWKESMLLQAGIAYQQTTDWHRRRPAWMN